MGDDLWYDTVSVALGPEGIYYHSIWQALKKQTESKLETAFIQTKKIEVFMMCLEDK